MADEKNPYAKIETSMTDEAERMLRLQELLERWRSGSWRSCECADDEPLRSARFARRPIETVNLPDTDDSE